MKNIYLILAVIGAIVPYLFFYQFIQEFGIDLPLFMRSLFVNGAAGGFSADLLIASLVFWLFMFDRAKKLATPKPYLFVVINLTIGLSCALPAYLYACDRHKMNTP